MSLRIRHALGPILVNVRSLLTNPVCFPGSKLLKQNHLAEMHYNVPNAQHDTKLYIVVEDGASCSGASGELSPRQILSSDI